MKKTMLIALILIFSGTGCFTWPHDARSPMSPVPMPVPLPAGPITADQVEAPNAHRVAEAVWDEMDRDQQKDLLPSTKESKKR